MAMKVQEGRPPQHSGKYGAKRAARSAAPNDGGVPNFYHMTRNPRPFRHQHDMIRFVKSAQSEDDVDFVVSKLGDSNGEVHSMLREILQVEMSVDAGNRASLYSFQRLVVPLVTLLSSPSLLNGPNMRGTLAIYTALLAERNFLLRGIDCLQKLAQRRSVHDLGLAGASGERTTSDVEWMRDYALPFCRLILAVLTRVSDAPAEDNIQQGTARLADLLQVWSTPSGERYGEEARECVRRSRTVLDDARRYEVAKRRTTEVTLMTPEMRVRQLMSDRHGRAASSTNMAGPGVLRPEGVARHDNDREFFREIKPTEQEVLCTAEPYLPVLPQPGSSQAGGVGVLGLSPLEAYLDEQFRLTREDMLDYFRDAVRTFLKDGALGIIEPGQSTLSIPESRDGGSLRLDVFRNLRFCSLAPRANVGMCVEVEFDAPTEAANLRTKKARERFWTLLGGSRRLQYCSLACAFTRIDGRDRLEFGWVAERKTEDLVGHGAVSSRCRVVLKMAGEENPLLLEEWTSRADTEVVLLQLRGHFFAAYDSVLRVLKLHTAATMPLQNEIISGGSNTEDGSFGPPAYVRGGTEFDLTCLLKRGNSDLKRVPVRDFKVVQERLSSCGQNLVLDGSQIDAVASALSTNVSLIQGPPGTGKSYVGVHIVRALLANRNQVLAGRPILCIAYTNHALDQFLHQLVESGVPLDQLVRMGSRTKSPVLQGRNLTALIREERNMNRRHEFYSLKDIRVKLEERFHQLRGALNQELKWKYIGPWLQTHYDRHWRQLMRPPDAEQTEPDETGGTEDPNDDQESVDDDEFFVAGRSDRVAKQRWTDWCYGHDIRSEFKVDDERAGSVERTVNHFAALQQLEEAEQSSDEGLESDSNEEDEPRRGRDGVASAGVTHPSSDRSLEELLSGRINLWQMALVERHKLLSAWTAEARAQKKDELSQLVRRYDEVSENIRQVDECSARMVLQGQSVVGCTTSGAAKYIKILRSVGARVIVCEEAGEVFESHLLASLTAETQQLILIGDHMQLRPKVNTHRLSRDSGHGYELDVSLFERLVSLESLQFHTHVKTMLCSQRRMRPKIAEIMRRTLYPLLEDAGPVRDYPDVRGFKDNLFFLDHDHAESKGSRDVSYCNTFEAQMVVQLVKYIVRQAYEPSQVAVITPYSGQLLVLRNMLLNEHVMLGLSERDAADLDVLDAEADAEAESQEQSEDSGSEDGDDSAGQGGRRGLNGIQTHREARNKPAGGVNHQRFNLQDRVRLATVDNFQGEEAEVVVVSTVRCNEAGRAGFLKIANRVNVMLSRAKHGMYILGSGETVRKSTDSRMFNAVLDYLESEDAVGPSFALRCQNHGHITRVATPQDFERVQDGGCDQLCGQRLSCGHACPRLCHPDNVHDSSQCREPCAKVLDCGHPCPRMCREPCGGCSERVTLSLECGHVATAVVCALRKNYVCREKVRAAMLMCDHVDEAVECWRARLLDKLRAAGSVNPHAADTEELLRACKSKCAGLRDCEHDCDQRCGDCAALSIRHLSDLKLPARVERTTHAGQCSRKCGRNLICGHNCPRVCCADGGCPPCEQPCTTRCAHSECRRQCNETCPACAYDCPWRCTHGAGQCPLPCASPCVRLPCDVRCERTLEPCGHQCPSLCGEDCPSSAYCRECLIAASGASDAGPAGKHAEHIVDLVMFTSLREHDPDDSPLVVLPCGHCYTVETLDGHLELASVYERSADGLGWAATRPLPSSVGGLTVSCPDCRMPIRNVRRYGRVVNAFVLASLERRFVANNERSAEEVRSAFHTARARAIAVADKFRPDSEKIAQVEKQMAKLAGVCQRAVSNVRNEAPTTKSRDLERRFWSDPRLEEQRRRFAAAEAHQPVHRCDQPLVTWLMLRLEVLDGFMRVHALRPDISKAKIKRVSNSAEKTRSKLERLCGELGMARSMQDARLLSAQVLIGIRHLAAISMTFGDVDAIHRQIRAKLDEAERHQLTEAQAARLQALRKDLEAQAKEVSRLELRMVGDAMLPDLRSYSGHWYKCPNGHIFAIGNCGMPVEGGMCIECGVPVGGGGTNARAHVMEEAASAGSNQRV